MATSQPVSTSAGISPPRYFTIMYTGVLANRTDLASVELPFSALDSLASAGPKPMSGSSASPTGAFSCRNELHRSLSSHSCSCSLWSGVTSGSSRCGALCLGQFNFELGDSLAEHLIWSCFCSSVSCFCSSATCFLIMLVCSSFFSGSVISRALRSLQLLFSTSLDHTSIWRATRNAESRSFRKRSRTLRAKSGSSRASLK